MPDLHIQNIYDALNPLGTGVTGHTKTRCIQLENRAIDLAAPGDLVAVNNYCPDSFIDYMTKILDLTNVIVLHHDVNPDPHLCLNSQMVLEGLALDPNWNLALNISLNINPYMQCPTLYKAVAERGVKFLPEVWTTIVENRLTLEMNDKYAFYRECEKNGVPVPEYWIAKGPKTVNDVIELLHSGRNPLFIRQTRTGGGLGKIAVELVNSRYKVHGKDDIYSRTEFVEILSDWIDSNFWKEFIVSELLDLYASPGTLFYVDDEKVLPVLHTFQVLDKDRKFYGFMYPVTDEYITKHFQRVEESLKNLMEPWRKRGFRGYGNIDWMVTKDGRLYFAERNARQTGSLPPLRIAHVLSRPGSFGPITAPDLSIVTRDDVLLENSITLRDVFSRLREKGLLWGQADTTEGVIISIPPCCVCGSNSLGIMAVSTNLPRSFKLFNRAIDALGCEETEPLLKPGPPLMT